MQRELQNLCIDGSRTSIFDIILSAIRHRSRNERNKISFQNFPLSEEFFFYLRDKPENRLELV
jgi:hypothetical protein